MAQYKVTFAYIKGMWYSFPSVESARAAVNKYTGNMDSVTYRKPSGVAINTTLGWSTDGEFADMNEWPDQVFAPEGVTGDALWNPPNNPITVETTIPVDDTTTGGDDTTTTTTGGDDTTTTTTGGDDVTTTGGDEEEVDLLDWSGLDQELLNLAKRYATAGMMKRAQAAFVKAGGTWSDAIHIALKEGSEETGYGGTIKFDWASLGVSKEDLQIIKQWAKEGKYGKIADMMGDNWSKDVHQKLQAYVHMGSKVDWDPVKGQGGDTTTTSGDDVTTGGDEETKTSLKTTRSVGTGPAGKGGVYDITTGQGSVEDITGAYSEGEKRLDAKEWRARQIKKLTKDFGADPKTMSVEQRKAWKKKRDQIILRHGKMIQK